MLGLGLGVEVLMEIVTKEMATGESRLTMGYKGRRLLVLFNRLTIITAASAISPTTFAQLSPQLSQLPS